MASTRKKPGLAVLLSVVPGLGNVYAGQIGKGLLLFLSSAVPCAALLALAVMEVTLESPGHPLGPEGGVPIEALGLPLYFLVIAPALVIYGMASSYQAVVKANDAAESPASTPRSSAAGPWSMAGNWALTPPRGVLWGAVLAALGVLLILPELSPDLWAFVARLWPLLVVGLGVVVILAAAGRDVLGRVIKW